ncbi:MAG: hypothetical protein ACM3ON_08115 [Chloroflexota bacterium]
MGLRGVEGNHMKMGIRELLDREARHLYPNSFTLVMATGSGGRSIWTYAIHFIIY